MAAVELRQLEQVELEFCRATMVLMQALLVELEGLECRPQLHHQRNREAQVAHLEEELRPLTLHPLEQRVAGA